MKCTASESNIKDMGESELEGSQDVSTGIEVKLGKNCDRKIFNEIFLMEPGEGIEGKKFSP